MAVLGKEKIRVEDKSDRNYFIESEFVLNVNADGYFTTTLSESNVKIIESYKIQLYTNGRSGARKGFFMNKTKEGLLAEIRKVLEQCISKTLIEEKIILRYSFCTVANFGLTIDGVVIPNMGWSEDGEINTDLYWLNGTVLTHAANPQATGVQMFVKAYAKRKFKFLDGRESTEYFEISRYEEKAKEKYYLRWISEICSTKPPSHGNIQEMDYTEQRAKFFVEMYKALCKLAHNIAKFTEPEKMIELIENGKYLM